MTTKYSSQGSVASFGGEELGVAAVPQKLWNRVAFWRSYGLPAAGGRSRAIGGYFVGIALIFLITLFYTRIAGVSPTTVGFTFLLVILCASTIWGLGVSCLMSVVATLAFDYYFLPPYGSLDIADPQDWVALFSFVVTAVLGSSLSARAQSRAEEATWRRQEVQWLYALSQLLLGEGDQFKLIPAVPEYIVESFGVEFAALFLTAKQEIHRAGASLSPVDENYLRLVATGKEMQPEGDDNMQAVPLRIGTNVIGSVGISGAQVSKGTMGALGCLVAAAIERAGAIERAAKLEAERQSEQFKSVLLDAVAHDFRTPLTGIKTSVTALLTDLEFDREQKKDLLAIIDEECDRIDELLDKASEMARLESGEAKLDIAPHSIGELVATALADCKRVSRVRPIHCEVGQKESMVLADLSWTRSVLVQLLVNAHLYSWPGQPITITCEEKEGFALISVADQGPGIEKAEAERIFEKFYRCKDHKIQAPGTGMGLPIARAIVEAQGGAMNMVSRFGHGSVFTFSLPLAPCNAGGLADSGLG